MDFGVLCKAEYREEKMKEMDYKILLKGIMIIIKLLLKMEYYRVWSHGMVDKEAKDFVGRRYHEAENYIESYSSHC